MIRNTRSAFILVLTALLLSPVLQGQSDRERAQEQLQQLHNGVLLVRLKTSSNTIEAMEKQGMHEEAEKRRQQQYEENKEIILSFSRAFDFAPVYFFYSNNSDDIREENFEGKVFGSDMHAVPEDQLEGKPVFTGEFGETPNTGIAAFIVMDENFVPLQSPFPFYQRQHIFFSLITLSKAKMIERYNEKLHSTYRTWFE